MAIKFLNNLETSTGSLTITKATTAPLLYLYNATNAAGATIRFSDQATPTQVGNITYYHSDSQSQGGGASFHFTSEPDTVLVVGSGSVNGRFVSKSAGSLGEVDYGFYDDTNTGMVRTSADNVSLVAGGVAGVGVGTTAVSLKHAGSTKLQTTSGGVGITGDVNTSGNANINGGNITINGSFPRFNMYSNDAGEDDWSIINNNGIFGIYNNTAADYALSISETVNTVIINSGNIQLNGTGRITGVDTVSAGTDAANKTYVDTAVSGVPIGDYLPLAAGSGSPLTGDLYITKNSPLLTITDTLASDLKLEIKQSGSTANFISRGGTSSKGQFNFRITDGTTVTNALFINQQANVGVGTNSPGARLDVAGDMYINSNYPSNVAANDLTIGKTTTGDHGLTIVTGASNTASIFFADNGNNDAGRIKYQHSNNSMRFETNRSEAMRIDSSGNVGIGTTSPEAQLQVGNGAGTQRILLYGANSLAKSSEIIFGDSSSGPITYRYGAGIRFDSNNNVLSFRSFFDGIDIADNSLIDLYRNTASESTPIRINFDASFSGNVGIGTTSPQSKLDVKLVNNSTANIGGTISVGAFAGLSFGYSEVGNSNYRHSAIVFERDDAAFGDARGKVHILNSPSGSTSADLGDARLTILPTGKVGIGTTSPYSALQVGDPEQTTAAELTIASRYGSSAPILNFRSGHASNNNVWNMARIVATDDGNYNGRLEFRTSNSGQADPTVKMVIKATGNVGIGTTAPSQKLHVAGNMRLQNQLYDSTNSIGSNGQVLTKTSAGTIWADNRGLTPTTPGGIVATIVGETIEIAFNQSTTSNIDYYQVWSSDDGGDYGIIGQIAPSDFSSTMTVVDTTFVTGGTMSYRVYAVKSGVYSPAGTVSKAYTVSALSVTNMTVVNLNTAYYIQYEKPLSRFIDHVEIYMDSQTTSAALNRSNASIVYSGQNSSYMRSVGTSNNFHQFWVEIVTS